MRFKFYKQQDAMDCGPTCLKMVMEHYGYETRIDLLRQLCGTTKTGSTLLGMSKAAEKIGFESAGFKVDFKALLQQITTPFIAHWNKKHFIVVYKIDKNYLYVADPAIGTLKYNRDEFLKAWDFSATGEGYILVVKPKATTTKELKGLANGVITEKKKKARVLFSYFHKYKTGLFKLMILLLISSGIQMTVPFLTQRIIDNGIRYKNFNIIYLLLIGQIALFTGRIGFDYLRSWVLVKISNKINLELVTGFFSKLMRLPISFFDKKLTGDFMQRINDQQRIEFFLTSSSLQFIFSIFTLLSLGAVTAYYNITIFWVLLFSTILYATWVFFFLRRRATIDYKRFEVNSANQGKIYEVITGMQDIKLHNAEETYLEDLTIHKEKVIHNNFESNKLEQLQTVGSSFINELKNVVITFLAATFVIEGKITLGMMLSISFILGQLNGQIFQMILFVQSLQDTMISVSRLQEINDMPDEESEEQPKETQLSTGEHIKVVDMSYSYSLQNEQPVLSDINCTIPAKKITAIVGTSGSGKSTFLKLLLQMYETGNGNIYYGNNNLKDISPSAWRKLCGTVMQEGFIFSGTIEQNITIGERHIDVEKFKRAVKIANIGEYIEQLPLKEKTVIGQDGVGLSVGQKQRILIARAVYKDPPILLFDEATSALDANNEKLIMQNLGEFFKDRTVIIIAHRLSTIKNADQIIVLENGKMVETGNHKELLDQQSHYYKLVKNQME